MKLRIPSPCGYSDRLSTISVFGRRVFWLSVFHFGPYFPSMPSAEIKPIYVLVGSDAFLRDEYRRSVVRRIIGQADPQIAVTTFDATAELAQVLDELRTMPFLAPRRAVIVSDADTFVSKHREALENYLQSPSSASALILIVSSWSASTRLAKLSAKIGEVFACSAPHARKLLAWVAKAAGKRGKKIAPDVAELLVEWCGADLAVLGSELEKLSLYVDERASITGDDVAAVVSATAGPAAFALTNAITVGDTPAALKALAGSLVRRGDEFKVLGLLAWHVRRALAAARQLAAGRQPSLSMPSQQRPAFLKMVKRRPLSELQNDFRRLLAADLAMKTGADGVAALQELVVRLSSQPGQKVARREKQAHRRT